MFLVKVSLRFQVKDGKISKNCTLIGFWDIRKRDIKEDKETFDNK